jgi:Spy/CpxP family protein refolding chaperone
MKKYTGWLVLGAVTVLSVVGLAAGTAAAQQSGNAVAAQDDGDEPGPGRGRMARIREELSLTDAQVEQARALREAFRDETKDLRDQIRTELEQIPQLVQQPDLSLQDLLDLQRSVHELAGQMGEKRVEKMYAFWQTLTAEQRAKAGELIQERGNELGHFFGFGPGGGPGEGHGRGGHGGGRPDGRGPDARNGAAPGAAGPDGVPGGHGPQNRGARRASAR